MAATAELTREEAARRYLQESRAASIHKKGSEGRLVHEETMARLQRRHPKVREHAIVGTTPDFDEPLGRNELEHQQHLRRQSRLTNPQILARRKDLRGEDYGRPKPSEVYAAANPQAPKPKPTRPERPTSRPGPRSRPRARTARTRSYARQTGIPAATKSTTQVVMEAIGIGIGLSLAYLVLEGKGPTALKTGLESVSNLLNLFISPVDPLNPSGAELPGQPAGLVDPQAANSAPYESVLSHENPQTKKEATKSKTFGPAPGAGSPLTQGVSP
jgi:hypothetical protein